MYKQANLIKTAAILLYMRKIAAVMPTGKALGDVMAFSRAAASKFGHGSPQYNSILRQFNVLGADKRPLWSKVLGIQQPVSNNISVGRGLFTDTPLPVRPGTRIYGKQPLEWLNNGRESIPIYDRNILQNPQSWAQLFAQ